MHVTTPSGLSEPGNKRSIIAPTGRATRKACEGRIPPMQHDENWQFRTLA